LSVKVTPDAAARSGVAGIPAAVRQKLERLGVRRAFDLVLHLPLRYEDETKVVRLSDAPADEMVQVEGEVEEASIQYRPKRMLVCRVRDGEDLLHLRFYNFYPSQQKQLVPGTRLRMLGELRKGFFGAEMIHPRFRVLHAEEPLPQSLTPVYPTTAGLSQAVLRKLVGRSLDAADLTDTLPQEVIAPLKLPSFKHSIAYLHSPPPDARLEALEERTHPAWRRVKFDELLAQQLSMRRHHRMRQTVSAPRLTRQAGLAAKLLAQLPFRLTRAQQRVLGEIRTDLAKPHPMQRLLQGDVGSGKTVVAALAALQAVESGYQVAIMAPTEILAEQHYAKFSQWLTPLGVSLARLAGNPARRHKRNELEGVARGDAKVVVGTHALFQEAVKFKRLGLAIVDEQHRFGVLQRLALRLKGSGEAEQPHQLMMSATPIPRTLAMSFYADLDVSVIDELPPGRAPVITKLLSESRRDEVVGRVRDACLQGRQTYWVCPLIEDNEAAARASTGPTPVRGRNPSRRRSEALQLQTVLDTFERIRRTFPELAVGLVHGRLGNAEKAAVMQGFISGAVQLLVATTVIEVGVDVPNASLMVIENAERMGLAQLHQLRGRVGRGVQSSVCILLYQNPLSDTARERLRIIYESSDGFEVARHDLRIRGPGELLGARQSGLPMLRFADLQRDLDLLEAARNVAERMLREWPERAEAHLQRWLGGRQEYLRV
jgi:ATP-dependent DNA helicase RecG